MRLLEWFGFSFSSWCLKMTGWHDTRCRRNDNYQDLLTIFFAEQITDFNLVLWASSASVCNEYYVGTT